MVELAIIHGSNVSDIFNKKGTMTCETSYIHVEYVNQSFIDAMIAVSAVTLFLNILSNSYVVYALNKTKQLYNPSLRLICYLSATDLCMALLGQTLYIAVLASPRRRCDLESSAEFFTMMPGHVSAWIIGLIGYDRYYRIKYLTRYSEFVKTWKIHVALVIGIIASLVVSSIQVIGIHYDVFKLMLTVTFVIDNAVFFLIVQLPYGLAIRVMKSHRRDTVSRELLNNVDGKITSTATRIMMALSIMYTPYIIFCMLRAQLPLDSDTRKEPWYNMVIFIGYQLVHTNSFVNAIIFLSYNTKCKALLSSLCFNLFTQSLTKQHNDVEMKQTNRQLDL